MQRKNTQYLSPGELMKKLNMLVGYDVRSLIPSYYHALLEDQVESHLLRPSASLIISCDLFVLPPALPKMINGSPRDPLSFAHYDPDNNLWGDFDEMRSFYDDEGGLTLEFTLIAPASVIERQDWIGNKLRELGKNASSKQGLQWHRLGFDVVDFRFQSGIVRTALSDSPFGLSRRRLLNGMLNEVHLIGDMSTSLEYAEVMNRNIQEHEPYLVIEIRSSTPLQELYPNV